MVEVRSVLPEPSHFRDRTEAPALPKHSSRR
ncbi:hypothetical protein E2C01_091005 [Portunus trituberculatus]|uniref:Uncharacterized protein n=1 Tax=Portunus trituberculatus TaxID=210409 RepID=A0A5B7JLW2_PORTR|nr:hypothetical protein [Portunus trituberculatus]